VTRPSILAVDDVPANLLVFEALLARDYEIVEARSGREAIAVLQQREVDLILLDVHMPDLDGFETARIIKQMEHAKEIPIIFITAIYNEDPYLKRGYEVGGIDYFSKPFDPELLKMKIAIYASVRQRSALLRERERQLHESEELLRTSRKLANFLEAIPVGVLIADSAGRITHSNDAVARICKSEDLVAHDRYGAMLGWWDAGGHPIRDDDSPLARALGGESSRNVRLDIEACDGSPLSLVCAASPLLGDGGATIGAVIVLQDVTEPQRVERDLEERVARLVSAGVQLEHSVRQ
jgi:CheY-like chemotaxis protein